MEWNKSLATGVDLIDSQHQELIRRINEVLEASMARKGKETVFDTLKFLGEYVTKHFADEESLQIKTSYPKYTQHKALHNQFIADYNALVRDYKKEGATLNMVLSTNKIVVDWLVKHINIVDKEFAAFYREHTA